MPVKPTQSLVDQARRKPLFFWIVLLISAVLLGFYLFSAVMMWRYGAMSAKLGWWAVRRDGQWVVTDVTQGGPAAGKLQVGDVILAVDDDPRIARFETGVSPMTSMRDVYTLEVLRGAEQRRLELQPEIRHDYRRLVSLLAILIAGLGFYVVGLVLGLARPEDRLTRRASLTLLVFAGYQVAQSLSWVRGFFTFWESIAFGFMYQGFPLQFGLAYYFYYHFPQSSPRRRFWTALQYVLFLWGGLLCCIDAWWYWGLTQNEPAAVDFRLDHAWMWSGFVASNPFVLTSAFAMCAVIVRNYRLVKEPDQRQRIKWVIYGSIIGIVPGLIQTIFLTCFLCTNSTENVIFLTSVIVNFATIAIPLSLGYAVLKHRAFDVNIVIRRGLQYLFAKSVLRLILALPIAGLLLAFIVNRDLPLTEILIRNPLSIALIATAGLSLKFRRQLTRWIDRLFFREAYNQEQILLNLIEQIKAMDSMPELSRLVCKEVENAMHPERLYVFYRGEEKRDLTLGYSSGGQSHDLQISETSELVQLMERQSGARDFPLPPASALPEDENIWLTGLGVNLIVPMSGADGRLAGLLLLGGKKSEAPYTPRDRQLLQTITAQMAVVYENVWLKEQAAKEHKIKHEVLLRLEEQQINLVKECPACGACYDSASQACAKDQRELTFSLPVERTVDNKYCLEQMIGRGGMGAVYEATDLRLNRPIAIKIMLGSMFGDRTALRRFEREAQASARLNHPNIITVYDYGAIRTDGAYLVMELVRGSTLRSELRRAGRLDSQRAAAWFEQLLEGVKAAHQAGVIHRDLKPENVLISGHEAGREQIKVVDFGLAKITQLDAQSQQSLTAPGMVMGTFSYMSPEQVTGEEVDERSDVFSLGVMVVEALTGHRPFQGRTPAEMIAAILSTPFHLSGESTAARRLDEVLQRCLAKSREQRFASVALLQQELIPAIQHFPALAPAVPARNAATGGEEATTEWIGEGSGLTY
jgi:eukaryotic-like serine/threonine-protein kinase